MGFRDVWEGMRSGPFNGARPRRIGVLCNPRGTRVPTNRPALPNRSAAQQKNVWPRHKNVERVARYWIFVHGIITATQYLVLGGSAARLVDDGAAPPAAMLDEDPAPVTRTADCCNRRRSDPVRRDRNRRRVCFFPACPSLTVVNTCGFVFVIRFRGPRVVGGSGR